MVQRRAGQHQPVDQGGGDADGQADVPALAASIGPLPVEPCRYRVSPRRACVVGNTTGLPALT